MIFDTDDINTDDDLKDITPIIDCKFSFLIDKFQINMKLFLEEI